MLSIYLSNNKTMYQYPSLPLYLINTFKVTELNPGIVDSVTTKPYLLPYSENTSPFVQ